MALDLKTYKPKGDKKNSAYFEEYRQKIYERRKTSGVSDMLSNMRAMLIQTDSGNAVDYMSELTVMTAYRFQRCFINSTHRTYVMMSKPEYPRLFVMEPLSNEYMDDLTRLNLLYPLSRSTPNARYIGEVFRCQDAKALQKELESQYIRFFYSGESPNPLYTGDHLAFTYPSDYTCNKVGYCDVDVDELAEDDLGDEVQLSPAKHDRLKQAAELSSEAGLDSLVMGVDHCATRVLAGEREDAILEFLTCSPYYFWGAYDIDSQNSSTNVNRNSNVNNDKLSPAKVFTANNIPSYANSFENHPMPTEDFVRNFGRRMHHIAHEVLDGDHSSGVKNIDYVVATLRNTGIPFLAKVVGECKDTPDLKQIFSKHSRYSLLITEYVERCHGFDGFFTRTNVADLTEAAGKDEVFKHGAVFD